MLSRHFAPVSLSRFYFSLCLLSAIGVNQNARFELRFIFVSSNRAILIRVTPIAESKYRLPAPLAASSDTKCSI